MHHSSTSKAGQSIASMTTSAPSMKSAISTDAAEPPRRRRDPRLRVEGAQPRRRHLDLQQAEVGRGVEDLAVEVGDLDPVAVDQPHLADPAGGERPGGPAAEPADAEHRDLRLAQPPLALRRHQLAAADVGEVAQLAIEACAFGRARSGRRRRRPRSRPAPASGRSCRRPPRRRTPRAARSSVCSPSSAASRRRHLSSGCSIRTSRLALGRRR